MRVCILKAARVLTLTDRGKELLRCRVALGREPLGAKRLEGDGRTPEGRYRICLVKSAGKYGRSLGLDYPGPEDAAAALKDGRIDADTYRSVMRAHAKGRRPPWGTPLGGEIYLHEGGAERDWTQGCIALEPEDMAVLFACREQIREVEILP